MPKRTFQPNRRHRAKTQPPPRRRPQARVRQRRASRLIPPTVQFEDCFCLNRSALHAADIPIEPSS
jgi:hypothetical protein